MGKRGDCSGPRPDSRVPRGQPVRDLRLLQPKLYAVGVVLLFLGFAMIVLGSFSGSNASVGGFVLIGPVPIVFGSGRDAGLLAILSVVAGLIVIAMVYLTFRQTRRMGTPEPIEGSNA
ncbi:MAG: DUF131 domain-containing protein [Thaumarchaeota archaeon]|nr:MAG: DUF131 domain-containing protein [Nitrososphaerota archaeon]